MSRLARLLFALIAALAGSQAARADVLYQFVVTSESPTLAAQPLGVFAPVLVVTDAAYAAGSLDYSLTGVRAPDCHDAGEGDEPCVTSGSGFVSLKNRDVLTSDTATDDGHLLANLTFQPNGELSGSLNALAAEEEDYGLSGSGDIWTGYFDSDAHMLCGPDGDNHTCTYTGYWEEVSGPEEVPEPPAVSMLAAGLVGFGWTIWRKRVGIWWSQGESNP